MENYCVIIEKAKNNYSAYSPDVQGLVSTGKTRKLAMKNFMKALEFHLEGLKEDKLPMPKPTSSFEWTKSDCSGILNVRTQKSLHQKLVALAKSENVSISHLVNVALIKVYG